jgi:RimJ/RimL family protein N-acetyltransferase
MNNKNIRLRKLTFSDAKFISDNAKDKNVTEYTHLIPPPFSPTEAKKFIKKIQEEMRIKKGYEFGIELIKTRELIGTVNLLNINYKNKNSDVGLWLSKKYWGKGFSREALSIILEFGFKKLKLVKIQARVLSGNIRSQKLLEKYGFKLEGRLRKKTYFREKWHDDLMYGILVTEFKKTEKQGI